MRRDDEAIVHSIGPGREGAPLLGALLAGAGLGMLDPLTRAEHLWQPFFDDPETDDSFTEPDPLAGHRDAALVPRTDRARTYIGTRPRR